MGDPGPDWDILVSARCFQTGEVLEGSLYNVAMHIRDYWFTKGYTVDSLQALEKGFETEGATRV